MAAFLFGGILMDLYIYSDESGVFDRQHNDIYVYGGLILVGKAAKEEWSRRYIAAERAIRSKYEPGMELKASLVSNKDKHKLVRSLNNCYKFGVVVRQKLLLDRIFDSKKDKQRYLDYAYKIGLKRALESMISEGAFASDEIDFLYVYVDEHTTATNGRYELREGLEQEFKNGTYNWNYGKFYEPLFKHLKGVNLQFCNSKTTTLVRAADHVANEIFHEARSVLPQSRENLHITNLP